MRFLSLLVPIITNVTPVSEDDYCLLMALTSIGVIAGIGWHALIG